MKSLEFVNLEEMTKNYDKVQTLNLFGSNIKVSKEDRDCTCLTWFSKNQNATATKTYNTTLLVKKQQVDKKLTATRISELLKASCVDTKHDFLVIFNK